MARKTEITNFFAGYRLESPLVQSLDAVHGGPVVRYGTDPRGKRALVRSWPRDIRGDLIPFWQHEIRQLRRLEGLAAAEGLFPPILAAGFDESGFHLINALGGRRLWAGSAYPWSSDGASETHALQWRNLMRIAQAIGLLHSQGIVHRSFGLASILTAGAAKPDFQLIGHEWSMYRVPASGTQREEMGEGPDDASLAEDLLLRDWRAFGELAARIVVSGSPADTLEPGDTGVARVRAQTRLLHHLRTSTRIDASQVAKKIEAIADAIELEHVTGAGHSVLFMPLGGKNALTAAIHTASEGAIAYEDLNSQRAFVQKDLAYGAVALAVPDHTEEDGFELMLRGSQLSYRHIRSFRHAEWSAAFCGDAQLAAVTAAPLQSQELLDPMQVMVIATKDPYLTSPSSSAGWLALRQRLQPRIEFDYLSDQSAQGLLLMLLVQRVVAMAEEYPVDAVERPPHAPSGKGFPHALYVRIREDKDREHLARVLKLRDRPGERLRQSIAGRSDRPSDSWRLMEEASRANDEEEPDTEWEFIGEHRDQRGTTFAFGGARPPQKVRRGLLVPADSAGTHKQLRRQYQLWRTLRNDRDLLRVITSADTILGTERVPLNEDEPFNQLDASKKGVLRGLACGFGLSLVQGPPGVGKTLLVSEFARQIMQARRGWRVLFSAQSHSAIDSLMAGVRKRLSSQTDNAPLIVRVRAQDPDRAPSEYDLSRQCRDYAQDFAESDLLRESPGPLQQQVKELVAVVRNTRKGASTNHNRLRRAFEALIVRAASLLFATSNSGAIERMVTEHAQFDWSIVEEAAKATGNELLGSLLLSRQRVMIGDHRQLPPFNAELLEGLFRSPARIMKLLELAEFLEVKLLPRAYMRELQGLGVRDEEDDTASALDELCEVARSHLYLFQSLHERQSGSPVLTFQHRMHPAIARVVSHAFYADALDSAVTCKERFCKPPPVRSADLNRYPERPIVWVATPWDQATRHRQPSESAPGPFNLPEVEAVMRILRNLKPVLRTTPNGVEPPTLAILSPYRAQVRALKSRLRGDGSLHQHVKTFRAVGDSYVHTVDSFQGREADVVIVSLVRNNASHTVRRALGFLADPRRMNVLLSRAQWRLFIVGCERFIRHVSQRKADEEVAESTEFLRKMFAAFDAERRTGCAALVPAERRRHHARRRGGRRR